MNATKKVLKGLPERSYSIVRAGGRVALPPGLANLKLGQRMYFHIGRAGVHLARRPRGLHHGRLLSVRLRRAIRSLASYGPRAQRRDCVI